MGLVSTLLRRERETEKLSQDASPASPWPCPHCGNPAEIEAVEPSLDGTPWIGHHPFTLEEIA